MSNEVEGMICVICGQGDRPDDVLMGDGFYSSLNYHVGCINSSKGREWRSEKFHENPAYARYWGLQAVGKRIKCPSCGFKQALSAKARGMGAGSWELVCNSCHRISPESLNGYMHPKIYVELGELEKAFLLGLWDEHCRGRIRTVAQRYQELHPELGCMCGGQYSILGKPRCVRCEAVLLDSYFHYSYEPTEDYNLGG
jgi:hypothetical protein